MVAGMPCPSPKGGLAPIGIFECDGGRACRAAVGSTLEGTVCCWAFEAVLCSPTAGVRFLMGCSRGATREKYGWFWQSTVVARAAGS